MTDGLPWFRQDSHIASKRDTVRMLKVKRIGPALFTLSVCAEGWSVGEGTDGVIPAEVLDRVHGTDALAAALVDLGIWREHPEGWEITDFAARQQLTVVTTAKQRAQSDGGRKGNCRRRHPPGCECWRQGVLDDE